MKDLLRRYLAGRIELGEPDIVLESLSRGEALRRVRRLAAGSAPSAAPRVDSGRADADAELRVLGERARACTRCALHRSRSQVVFGEGSETARVVCVGEAPGAREDATGRPFVGRAGKLLDRLLLTAGFARNSVYICNVLKCRPPGNRDPLPEEIEACSPFLLRQLELIRPAVIVAFGAFAARTLLQTRESLGRLRERTHLYRGYPVIVTYHPAALLRNPGWIRPTWEDLQKVRRRVDETESSGRAGGSARPGAEAAKNLSC
ncbi:MAG: uracil-DNA glycosylase [Gemmatimonadota bacterium]